MAGPCLRHLSPTIRQVLLPSSCQPPAQCRDIAAYRGCPASTLAADERRGDEAARHVRTGFGLAERGAFLAARSEFVQSLRLLSRALDVQNRTARHSQALAAGMRALDEAEDFAPCGSRLEADLDVPMLIAGHRCAVRSQRQRAFAADRTAAIYSYAQEQLGIAAAGEPADRWLSTG